MRGGPTGPNAFQSLYDQGTEEWLFVTLYAGKQLFIIYSNILDRICITYIRAWYYCRIFKPCFVDRRSRSVAALSGLTWRICLGAFSKSESWLGIMVENSSTVRSFSCLGIVSAHWLLQSLSFNVSNRFAAGCVRTKHVGRMHVCKALDYKYFGLVVHWAGCGSFFFALLWRSSRTSAPSAQIHNFFLSTQKQSR